MGATLAVVNEAVHEQCARFRGAGRIDFLLKTGFYRLIRRD
jgi:hypothetical protein